MSDEAGTIVTGLSVSPGIVVGPVRVLRSPNEIDRLNPGEILVVPNSHPGYSIALSSAAGLICEVGGRLSHTCIVALEMGVPCITGAQHSVDMLQQGKTVCLDANRGIVYAVDG